MEHFHQNIQGWFQCEPLYKRMVEKAKDGSIFVEIGAWKGKSAAFMAVEIINSGKDIDFYTVDHFEGSPEHKNDKSIQSKTLKEECIQNLFPVGYAVSIIAMPSAQAAKMFEDGSVDFVYIDGAHEYDDLKADITTWGPKVKNGGIIAGDDYGVSNHPDVKRVVDEIFPSAEKEGFVWIYQK